MQNLVQPISISLCHFSHAGGPKRVSKTISTLSGAPLCTMFPLHLLFLRHTGQQQHSPSFWSHRISAALSASRSPLYQLITAHFPLKASLRAAGPAKHRGHFLQHTGRKACRCQSQLKSIWPRAVPHCAHHNCQQPIRYRLNYSLRNVSVLTPLIEEPV